MLIYFTKLINGGKMKIGFDIDGTLTNFEKFIINNSQTYMQQFHNLQITNPNGYDLDQMYEIEKAFLKRGYSENYAYIQSNNILNEYWKKFYIKYLFKSFRDNIGKAIKVLYYSGNEIFIFSSRKLATDESLIGKFVRLSTISFLKLHGVKTDEILFFENDSEKIEEIKKRKIDIMFEDKPELINQLSSMTNVVCVDSNYNQQVEQSERIYHIDGFEENKVIDTINQILQKRGEKSLMNGLKVTYFHRMLKYLCKRENNPKFTDKCYKLLRTIGKPLVMKKFDPIILNAEKAKLESPVIVSPNHRSTLDPFFVIATTDFPIHWAALKRFFDADDSIFNNSKKSFLKKVTSLLVRSIGTVPIERVSDNPKANNKNSVIRMTRMVRNNQSVGVFPEGTTNKNPDLEHIGTSDRSGNLAFSLIRESPKAKILPISISWIKDTSKIKNKLIVNYGDSISYEDVKEYMNDHPEIKFIDAADALWEERIISGLLANIELEKRLTQHHAENNKGTQKVYYKNGNIKMR